MAGRRTITQQRFRLREDLLIKLRRAADANDRSLNEEVEARLEGSFTKDTIEKTVKAASAEMIKETAQATAYAWVDGPIEAELARGGELNLASFPPWMLVSWAKRHPEHPEAVRILEQHEKWLRGLSADRLPKKKPEAEQFVDRTDIGKGPRRKSEE
jgi:Arc-like DNA binding dprotein